MNLYIENRSLGFIKKAVNAVKENTKKDVFKLFVINYKGGFSYKAAYYARKKHQIYDIEYVIYGEKGLNKAIKYLNRNKKTISLTLIINKPLSQKSQNRILKIKKELKIVDLSGCEQNVGFYKACNKILYKTDKEDIILDADIMHLYKFYETVFQCRFSSCLGKNIFVTRDATVHFCPNYLDESFVGTLNNRDNYFENQTFKEVLHSAVEKRDSCKNNCEYYEYCSGACPLENGCCGFPERFKKNKEVFDRITQNNESLVDKNFVVAKIVIKDIAYGE